MRGCHGLRILSHLDVQDGKTADQIGALLERGFLDILQGAGLQKSRSIREGDQGDFRELGDLVEGILIGFSCRGRRIRQVFPQGDDKADTAAIVKVKANAVIERKFLSMEFAALVGEFLPCSEDGFILDQAGNLLDGIGGLFSRVADEGRNGGRYAGDGRRKQGFFLYIHAGCLVLLGHNEKYLRCLTFVILFCHLSLFLVRFLDEPEIVLLLFVLFVLLVLHRR